MFYFVTFNFPDDCPNSGEDSDEDVITDYIGSELPDCNDPSIISSDNSVLNTNVNMDNKNINYNTKYEMTLTPSVNDTKHTTTQININNQQVPIVPTISITPNSPGFNATYPILEDNLQELHEITKWIQRMRITKFELPKLNNNRRLSSSCPSLCSQYLKQTKKQFGLIDNINNNSDPDLINCSTNSSPTHYQNGNNKIKNDLLNTDRRRSWTDVEKTRNNRHRNNVDDDYDDVHNHLQTQPLRQRSISLSSLDSDIDLVIDDKSSTVGVANRSCRSQISTHSLNEADFVQVYILRLIFLLLK